MFAKLFGQGSNQVLVTRDVNPLSGRPEVRFRCAEGSRAETFQPNDEGVDDAVALFESVDEATARARVATLMP
jgi:hypothetical protein